MVQGSRVLLLHAVVAACVVLASACGTASECDLYVQDLNTLTNYVLARQYTNASLPATFGAIRLGINPGVYIGDVAWFNINPYFSGLALRGILQQTWDGVLNATLQQKVLTATEAWIDFTLNHLSPDGYPWDWWVSADGTNDTSCIGPGVALQCNHADSEDSYLAMILGVSWLYKSRGGSTQFISQRLSTIESMADKLVALMDSDNLTIALRSYAIKYTMDNAEAWWGLDGMSKLETAVGGSRASFFQGKADALRAAILTLYNANYGGGRWKYFKDNNDGAGDCDGSVFYYRAAPVVWPVIFGVVAPESQQYAVSQVAWINSRFDGTNGTLNWSVEQVDPPFWWPAITYSAVLTESCARGVQSYNTIKSTVFPSLSASWSVPDAGWFALAVDSMYRSNCVSTTSPVSTPTPTPTPTPTKMPVTAPPTTASNPTSIVAAPVQRPASSQAINRFCGLEIVFLSFLVASALI
eukprot:TRINITY_DN10031_c0_g1_i1.p1 TRINITY_DN10031_c0_g1~~TRINITY_DN10031_c0_g1_i1.p1  ORF type:complete len:469 (+),score=46.40 TRINITY_DN10031_c0_g1_i1:16-1422(+)